jgi:hypothetical protein
MDHPYADLMGLTIDEMTEGHSLCSLQTDTHLYVSGQ